MVKERLKYKKINDFIKTLNTREKQYIIKKLNADIQQSNANIVDFTINGQKIVNS